MPPTTGDAATLRARSLVDDVTGHPPVAGLSAALVGPGRTGVDAAATGVTDVRTGRAMTTRTLLHACSMSKLVAAVTVVRLAQDGVLDLDADIDDLVGAGGWRLARPPGSPVTLRSLLSHQAGISDAPGSFAPLHPGLVVDVEALLAGATPHHRGPVVASRAPGQFEYSDAGYCVVEHVVREATRRPYSHVANDLVLGPLGLAGAGAAWAAAEVGSDADHVGRVASHDVAVGHDSRGLVVRHERPVYPGLAAAGLWATPTALATLLADLLASWHGDPGVLSPQSVRDLWTAPGETRFAALGAFLLRHDGEVVVQTHGWGEGFQGIARVHLDRRTVVVAMTNTDPGVDQDASVLGAIADTVTEQPRSAADPGPR